MAIEDETKQNIKKVMFDILFKFDLPVCFFIYIK